MWQDPLGSHESAEKETISLGRLSFDQFPLGLAEFNQLASYSFPLLPSEGPP